MPIARADSTYGCSRFISVVLRTSRAMFGAKTTDSAKITFCVAGPKVAMIAIASRMLGNASNPSMTRISGVSIRR